MKSMALPDAPVVASPLILPREDKKAPRAYCVGMTGSGKSTLMEVLMWNYIKAYSQETKGFLGRKKSVPVRTLIIDTKPRFKAEFELNGLETNSTGRYSKWGIDGSGVVPGSFVLPRYSSAKSEIKQWLRLGGNIGIVQTESKDDWPVLIQYARHFFEGYGSKYPRLLVVDELADFYEKRTLGDIFQRIARNGRERDVAFIAGSQRPRKIPVETMTEMMRLYLFELDYDEDFKHIVQFGLPWQKLTKSELERLRPFGHTFFMWDRVLKMEDPSNKYYELDLGA